MFEQIFTISTPEEYMKEIWCYCDDEVAEQIKDWKESNFDNILITAINQGGKIAYKYSNWNEEDIDSETLRKICDIFNLKYEEDHL